MDGVDNGSRDVELAERFRGGDPRALEELFGRHEPALRQFVDQRLPRRLRGRIGVSDIVQETRIVAFQHRSDLRDAAGGGFRNWVFAIAVNRVRDALRRHEGAAKRAACREAPSGARPATDALEDEGPQPSEVARRTETSSLVHEVLGSMSCDDRTLLELVHFEGYRLAEAGEAMGRSREAAKKLYGRALRRFAAEIRRRGG